MSFLFYIKLTTFLLLPLMINLQILLGDINNLPRGVPGEYLEYDNYFENENINDLEKYHHIKELELHKII